MPIKKKCFKSTSPIANRFAYFAFFCYGSQNLPQPSIFKYSPFLALLLCQIQGQQSKAESEHQDISMGHICSRQLEVSQVRDTTYSTLRILFSVPARALIHAVELMSQFLPSYASFAFCSLYPLNSNTSLP
jgi:hypothetical protein